MTVKIGQHLFVFAGNPAGTRRTRAFENRIHPVFIHQTAGNDFELQHTDGSQNQVAAHNRFENLNGTFFTQLLQALVQLLDLQWVANPDTAEISGAKKGMPVNCRTSPSEKLSPICILP